MSLAEFVFLFLVLLVLRLFPRRDGGWVYSTMPGRPMVQSQTEWFLLPRIVLKLLEMTQRDSSGSIAVKIFVVLKIQNLLRNRERAALSQEQCHGGDELREMTSGSH